MRPEKASIVSDLVEKLNRSPFLLVTDYQRMNVDQFGELRNRLGPAGAELRVVKNSFLKRAMTDSGMPDVADKLRGQTAIVMGKNDVAPAGDEAGAAVERTGFGPGQIIDCESAQGGKTVGGERMKSVALLYETRNTAH